MNKSVPGYRFRYRGYSEALYRALKRDPFYVAMENSVSPSSQGREAMFRYHDYSMVEAERYGVLFTPPGQPYGVSVWSKPLAPDLGQRKKREKREFLQQYMGTASVQMYEDIVASMDDMTSPLVDAGDWYLSIVGVLPEHQGQGLGASLIVPVLEKADSLGISTYLETFTPRNEKFYQGLGYRIAGVFHEPATGANYSLMVRNPGDD